MDVHGNGSSVAGQTRVVMPKLLAAANGKGHLLVDNENYTYQKVNEYKGNTNWRCSERRNNGCKATATTKGMDPTTLRCKTGTKHSHPSNLARLRYREEEARAKKNAVENPTVPPRSIVGRLSNTLSAAGQALPKSTKALVRSIQRARASAGGHPKAPKMFKEFLDDGIPEHMRKTADGSLFLRYCSAVDDPLFTEDDNGLAANYDSDNGGNDHGGGGGDATPDDQGPDKRVALVFMSPFGIELLRQGNMWQGDGTFGTCPAPFAQIYVVFGATSRGKVLPAAYCLLPDKRRDTYLAMWQAIQTEVFPLGQENSGSQMNPKPANMLFDFECACISSFESVFPFSSTHGCYFHFRKCTWSQLGKKGCLRDYNRSEDFQRLVGLSVSLAFVPPAERCQTVGHCTGAGN